MTSEDLTTVKEIAVPLIAAISTIGTGFLAYLQSKCRRDLNTACRDLDLAYGEIRFLRDGKRTVRSKKRKGTP